MDKGESFFAVRTKKLYMLYKKQLYFSLLMDNGIERYNSDRIVLTFRKINYQKGANL